MTNQSSLHPAGVEADRIASLFWLYVAACTAVYVLVMAVILVAVWRRRERQQMPSSPDARPAASQERSLTRWVTIATAVTIAILFVLLVGDFRVGQELQATPEDDPLVIEITARQWWWEVRYKATDPGDMVITANEIHIPVGRTIEFEIKSPDVIHSFWVPNLQGKRDIIPGYVTKLRLRAEQPGTYWGQCAEFCGQQHATMRFAVVVESKEDFDAWYANQQKPGREPQSEGEKRGQQAFLKSTCINCHTIGGTPAFGLVGPNLTHLASRLKIASGTLPNQRGHLGGWVVDPQKIRPGVRMPVNPVKAEDLPSLLDYLESLK